MQPERFSSAFAGLFIPIFICQVFVNNNLLTFVFARAGTRNFLLSSFSEQCSLKIFGESSLLHFHLSSNREI